MKKRKKIIKRRRPRKAKPVLAFILAFVPSGMQYCPDVRNARLKEGDVLELRAQHDNAFDPFAIKVLKDGQQIGWFPRALGDPVRMLLHRVIGTTPVYAKLSSLRSHVPQVSLYLVKS